MIILLLGFVAVNKKTVAVDYLKKTLYHFDIIMIDDKRYKIIKVFIITAIINL